MSSSLHVAAFVTSRIGDLQQSDVILDRLEEAGGEEARVGAKRKFFLRRRTTSYVKYKIPRLLAQKRGAAAAAAAAAVKSKSTPKPGLEHASRKQRRGMRTLLRQHRVASACVWLETHLWHRKRFFMRHLWGHVLATRAFSRHGRGRVRNKALHKLLRRDRAAVCCTVHDCSYLQPLELCGCLEAIEEVLADMCDPVAVRALLAARETAQVAELPLLLYHAGAFPERCLGPAGAIWCSYSSSEPRLWLWLHPSILSTAHGELAAHARAETGSLSVRNLSSDGAALTRYAVRGTDSLLVLARVVRGVRLPASSSSGSGSAGSGAGRGAAFFEAMLQNLSSVQALWPEGAALCLDAVNDGHLRSLKDGEGGAGAEKQKQQAVLQGSSFRRPKSVRLAWPQAHAQSCALFDPTAREALRDAFPSDKAVNDFRHSLRAARFGLSGDGGGGAEQGQVSFKKAEARAPTDPFSCCPSVPVMLVRLLPPSSAGGEEFSGFDLILPYMPGAPFWRLLQRAGAAAVGIEEHWCLQKSAGVLSFPRDYPETRAGEAYWGDERLAWADRNAKRPKAKRLGEEAGVDMRAVVGFGEGQGQGGGSLMPGPARPFVVVRQRSYAQTLIRSLVKEMEKEEGGEEGEDGEGGEEEEEGGGADTLPFTTLVPVVCLVPCGQRGYPVDGALIFPASPDSSAAPPAERRPIGCVTSGDCVGGLGVAGAGAGGGRGARFGLGLCLASGVAELRGAGREMRVQYRNPNSQVWREGMLSLYL